MKPVIHELVLDPQDLHWLALIVLPSAIAVAWVGILQAWCRIRSRSVPEAASEDRSGI